MIQPDVKTLLIVCILVTLIMHGLGEMSRGRQAGCCCWCRNAATEVMEVRRQMGSSLADMSGPSIWGQGCARDLSPAVRLSVQ